MERMFVLLTLLLFSTAAFPDWEISKQVDAMTDEAKAIVYRASDNGPKQSVAIRCGKTFDSDGLDVMLIVNEYLSGDSTAFQYRFDSEEPKTATGTHSGDDTTIFLADAFERGFIEKMKLSSRLVIRVTPYREGTVTFIIDLKGFSTALAQACTGLI